MPLLQISTCVSNKGHVDQRKMWELNKQGNKRELRLSEKSDAKNTFIRQNNSIVLRFGQRFSLRDRAGLSRFPSSALRRQMSSFLARRREGLASQPHNACDLRFLSSSFSFLFLLLFLFFFFFFFLFLLLILLLLLLLQNILHFMLKSQKGVLQ